MAEPDLTSLARAWTDLTTEPEFDALVGRAHARRRRRVLALVASAAAVGLIAGLSTVLLQRGPAAAPPPTDHPRPSPTQTNRTGPSWIVAHGWPVSYSENDSSELLTVFQHCAKHTGGCRVAWELRLPDQEILARHRWRGPAPMVYSSGQRFVLRSYRGEGAVVDPDGSVRQVRRVPPGDVGPGDVLVPNGRGVAVVNPGDAVVWPLPVPTSEPGVSPGQISSDGTVWAMPIQTPDGPPFRVRVSWLRHGTWQTRQLDRSTSAVPGGVAVSGDHVAALSSFDGATVLPVGVLAVTSDGGDTWTDLRKEDLPFDAVDSMAATSGGTLYIGGYGSARYSGVYRSTDATWTHFEKVPGTRGVSGVVPAGRVVLGLRGTSDRRPPRLLAVFDDHGNRTDVPIR